MNFRNWIFPKDTGAGDCGYIETNGTWKASSCSNKNYFICQVINIIVHTRTAEHGRDRGQKRRKSMGLLYLMY